MKWTIPQLRKLSKPFNFEFNLDLNEHLEILGDVVSSERCFVSGTCKEVMDDVFEFKIAIDAVINLECAISLEVIPFDICYEITELFGYDDDYSTEVNLIEKDTIDLSQLVLSEIIVSKPMKVVKDGYEDSFVSEEEYEDSKKEKINPSFAGLKDLIGGNE